MLLKLFNLTDEKFSVAAEHTNISDDRLIKTYDLHYGIKIIETDIEEYVNSLFEKCRELNLLREKKEPEQISVKDELKELMRQDELEEAINLLIDELEKRHGKQLPNDDEKELLGEVLGLSARYHRFERAHRKKTITDDEADTTRNKIFESLSSYIDELEF